VVEGGTIRILSKLQDSQLHVTVANSGIPGPLQTQNQAATNGIGLKNTAERLKTLYGTAHNFVLEWPKTVGCQVTIELPYRRAAHEVEAPACVR
jgi:two-component system, LytTR family, sensor kinase